MPGTFITVGKIDEFASGRGRLVTVDGRDVALFRLGQEFFAIDNTCLHRGGPLCEGFIEDEVVTCPLHGWSYEIRTGTMVQDPRVGVSKHEVHLEGDRVCVRLTE